MERSRCFSLTTYLPEAKIMSVLLNHLNQVRVYAFAYHDKDIYTDEDRAGELKEAHTHILIVTYSATTCSAVRRWFYGFKDNNGEIINTLCQVCKDKYSYYDYLTHCDAKSRSEGKYLYDESIIKCSDFDFFKGHSKAELDTANLIIDYMLDGVDYNTLRKRFGRDFVLNFDKYKTYAFYEECYQRYNQENEFCVNARIKRELDIDY